MDQTKCQTTHLIKKLRYYVIDSITIQWYFLGPTVIESLLLDNKLTQIDHFWDSVHTHYWAPYHGSDCNRHPEIIHFYFEIINPNKVLNELSHLIGEESKFWIILTLFRRKQTHDRIGLPLNTTTFSKWDSDGAPTKHGWDTCKRINQDVSPTPSTF